MGSGAFQGYSIGFRGVLGGLKESQEVSMTFQRISRGSRCIPGVFQWIVEGFKGVPGDIEGFHGFPVCF